MIETDVCITKDGEVLCLHDPHLLRLCGIDEESSNVNLENIVYLKKIPTEFSAGVGVFTTQEGELAKPITLDVNNNKAFHLCRRFKGGLLTGLVGWFYEGTLQKVPEDSRELRDQDQRLANAGSS